MLFTSVLNNRNDISRRSNVITLLYFRFQLTLPASSFIVFFAYIYKKIRMVKNSMFFLNIRPKIFYMLMVTCVWVLLISIWLYFDSQTTAKLMFKLAKAKSFMFNGFTNSRMRSQVTDENNRTFLILYWGFPWGLKSYVPPEGRLTWNRCEVTHDWSRIENADLVMFHYTTIQDSDMPWKFYR